jgi:hypothetical protein
LEAPEEEDECGTLSTVSIFEGGAGGEGGERKGSTRREGMGESVPTSLDLMGVFNGCLPG